MEHPKRKVLRLLRGFPGAGKSTYARSRAFGGMLHLENDQFWVTGDGEYRPVLDKNGHIETACYKKAKQWLFDMVELALQRGVSLIISDCFVKRSAVQTYKDLADKYGYEFYVACMHGNFKNLHDVPDDVLKRMKTTFEPWPGETNIGIDPETHEYFTIGE